MKKELLNTEKYECIISFLLREYDLKDIFLKSLREFFFFL